MACTPSPDTATKKTPKSKCAPECQCEDTGTPPFIAGQDHTTAPYRVRCQHEFGLDSGIYPFLHKKASQTVDVWYPTLGPTPAQRVGPPNGGGNCDCSKPLTYPSGGVPSGANWTSITFDTQPETWQGAAQNLLATSPPFQTFAKGAKEDLGQCHNFGFKTVGAQSQWYGTPSFTSNDSCTTPDRTIAADGTRYRTLTATFSYSCTSAVSASMAGGGQPAATATIALAGKVAVTVDKHSGLISVVQITPLNTTGTDCGSFTSPNGIWVYTGSTQSAMNATAGNCDICMNAFPNIDPRLFLSNLFGQLASSIKCGGYFDGTTIQNMEWMALSFKNANSSLGMALSGGSTTTNATATGSYDTPLVLPYTGPDSTGSLTVDASISATTFHYDSTWAFSVGVTGTFATDQQGTNTGSFSLDLVLSDAWAATDLVADMNSDLLVTWPLTDHALYPWRHDQFPSIMPLVTWRQVPGPVTPLIDVVNAAQGLFSASIPSQASATDDGSGNLIIALLNPANLVAGQSVVLFGVPPTLVLWVAKTISSVTDSTHFKINGLTTGDLISGVQSVGFGSLPYDAAIIGAPNPNGAGAYGWFDFYYTDWRFCQPNPSLCSGDPLLPYIFCKGGNLADAQISLSNVNLLNLGNSGTQYSALLPQCATHWTNNVAAHNIPRGAMIDIGGVEYGSGMVTVVKAAYARLPVPSYNFFRPCGSDRVLVDELTVNKITTEWTPYTQIYIPNTPTFPSLTGQTLLVYGSTTCDGIYTGCTYASNIITLGTKIAAIPTGYTHPFMTEFHSSGGQGFCGIVRFPNAWALCGRQAITFAAVSVGVSNITFSSPQANLRTADFIDLSDTSMTSVSSNLAVIRIDDSNFTVAVDASTLTGSVWATSHGAPAWYWNDSSQKFDVRYQGWSTNSRPSTPVITAGGCQADCVPMSPCYPQVVSFSPNSAVETWPTMTVPDGMGGTATVSTNKNYWFGASTLPAFVGDAIYGYRVQANVEFDLPDLLWQAPAHPASDGNTYLEDDGTCPMDGVSTFYYAPRPRMEALCSPPGGSPSLPTDAVNGALTWPAMVQPVNPGVVGVSYTVNFEYWSLYANELATITAGGCRFLSSYYAHTIGGDK